ncbi:Integral membrane protein S linking to the trans Golgi network [Aneurinibacillus thermoaerophilus]|uniref:Integral membrane protein S linking to the trans Golgi network n=1 Tax=Aneurinibacillus thermoaerophilus TaxID=143495 RepID=A0A1G8EPF7_ANETH|nr:Integral membrane protein S linking to the trans Golgi network [Aneurinibacillus thermoaerophilus]
MNMRRKLLVDIVATTLLYIFCIVWMYRMGVSANTFWFAVIFVGSVILFRIYNGFFSKKNRK